MMSSPWVSPPACWPPAATPTWGCPGRMIREFVPIRPLWLTLAVVTGALATWAGWMARAAFVRASEPARVASVAKPSSSQADTPDAGPVGLGEAATSIPTPVPASPSASETMAADSPPEPSPGQAQPDTKGRCPHPQQAILLNGGCWLRLKVSREECEILSGHMYQEACYVPLFTSKPGRPTTSGPGSPR